MFPITGQGIANPPGALAWVLVIACALVLAGCTTANTRRDLDVTGSLPRAIGLGAFAPTCFFLCFVSAETAQGDTVREKIDTNEAPLTIHGTTATEFKATRNKLLKPNAKTGAGK